MVKISIRVEDLDPNGRGVFDGEVTTGPTALGDPAFFLLAVRRAGVQVSEEMHVGPEAEAYREKLASMVRDPLAETGI